MSAGASASTRRETRRLPPNAQLVLDTLRAEARPLKAYAILAALEDRGIRAPMTVYRALDRLIAERLVTRVDSQNAFFALPDAEDDEPLMLVICERCGEANAHHIPEAAAAAFVDMGLDLNRMSIEAQSRCSGCSAGVRPYPVQLQAS